MLNIKKFTFNPISVNAFILWDETLECALVDPGCFYAEEEQQLKQFIESNQLKPVRLLNTHGHFDHLMGNKFVKKMWDLKCEIHREDNYLLEHADTLAKIFGIEMPLPPPSCGKFFEDGDVISFGNSEMNVIHVPGHSPGSVAFYSEANNILITGDILFNNSIGRTDLPKGNYDLLISGILEKLMTIDEKVKVYCGHGPDTTIGEEKSKNPFLR